MIGKNSANVVIQQYVDKECFVFDETFDYWRIPNNEVDDNYFK